MLAKILEVVPRFVEVGSVEAALDMTADATFDLIFLDLGLPGLGGLDGLRAIRQKLPTACVVVLSAVEGAEMVRQALLYGAQGYIPKTVSAEEMKRALQQILDGQIYRPVDHAADNGETRLDEVLTTRQTEVLAELCAGRSNREISEYLGMSENTVRAHVSATFRQLDVRSRTEAVLLAKRKGLF
jgi:two-component system, NarL family, nitrate/nitrite response regulator NarL